jgi:glycosyltransferase involved in cell wall biosynthesis
MKIAFLGIKTFPPEHGGMEAMTSSIIAELVKDPSISVTVLPLYSSSRITGLKNLSVLPIQAGRIPYVRSILGGIAGVVKAFEIKPDLVHLNGLENAYLLPLLRMFGLKTVLHIHGTKWTLSEWGGSRFRLSNLPIRAGILFFRINLKCFASFAQRIITVNEVGMEELPPRARKRTVVVYNSLDISYREDRQLLEQEDLSPGGYLLYIGRIVPLKGLHYLIQAYNRLPHLSFPLVIVGRFDAENPYHAYIKHMATGVDIRFIGPFYGDSAYTLIKNARLLVLPSETEGMAVSILEAALLKTPILASDIPENARLWGDTIHYFRNKDVTSLTESLDTLIKDEAFCNSRVPLAFEMGTNKFNHRNQMARLLDVYQRCISSTSLD